MKTQYVFLMFVICAYADVADAAEGCRLYFNRTKMQSSDGGETTSAAENMGIFARSHERNPAQKARPSVLRRIFDKKGGQARPEVGSAASSVSGNSFREEHSGGGLVNPVLKSVVWNEWMGTKSNITSSAVLLF